MKNKTLLKSEKKKIYLEIEIYLPGVSFAFGVKGPADCGVIP